MGRVSFGEVRGDNHGIIHVNNKWNILSSKSDFPISFRVYDNGHLTLPRG